MTLLPTAMAPLAPEPSEVDDAEANALLRLARAGLRVAPFRVLPARAEEYFYYLNNLPEQLGALFRDLDPHDPDEDELEARCDEAQRILLGHYLLDESIDLFYEAIAPLPLALRLRRPNGAHVEYARRGRPALLAIKKLWSRAWAFEALSERLSRARRLAPEAQAVLILAAGRERADEALTRRASEVLGAGVEVWLEPAFGIARLAFLESGTDKPATVG